MDSNVERQLQKLSILIGSSDKKSGKFQPRKSSMHVASKLHTRRKTNEYSQIDILDLQTTDK